MNNYIYLESVTSYQPLQTLVAELPQTAAVDPDEASQASGYMHPETCTAARLVSAGSAHPFPPVTVAKANIGVESVGTAPVAVYMGNCVGSAPLTFERDGGGYCENAARAVEVIVPAPTPPVCQD